MRVIVNHKLCQGHATCMLRAPKVYQLDSTGYNRMEPFEVPEGLEAEARLGAANCPEGAIRIVKS